MNYSRIAKTILQSQTNMGAVDAFAIKGAVTQEEYSEALARGWIEAREDGCVGLPSRASCLDELRAAAASEGFKPAEVDHALDVDTFASYPRFVMRESLAEDVDPGVGDECVVAEGGKTYTASVASRNADGTYKLSFSGDKPTKDSFTRSEIRVTKPVAVAATAPATPPPPAAPVVPAASPVGPGLAGRA
jgi:hypothetical protein